MNRDLDWDACLNTRDLGGLPAARGMVRRGAVVRSDTLARLTRDGWTALTAHGVRTIIDLRADDEVTAGPVTAPDGVGYRRVPVFTGRTQAAVVRAAQTRAELYAIMLDGYRASFAQAVEAVVTAPPGGVAVHCLVGKDRTGIVVALLLSLVGAPREAIAEDYALSADRLAPLFDRLADEARTDGERDQLRRDRQSPAAGILTALEHVDEHYGSVERYLERLAPSMLELARARLVG